MMWHMALSLVSGETVPWTEVNSWGNQSKSCHYLSFDGVKLRLLSGLIFSHFPLFSNIANKFSKKVITTFCKFDGNGKFF